MFKTYVLGLWIDRDVEVNVGRLGDIAFRRGYYAYVGSALKGFKARIDRHIRRRKKLFWHIDYLTTLGCVDAVEIFCIRGDERLECEVAGAFNDEKFIHGFGVSDCRCKSHLFYIGDDLISSRNHVVEKLDGVFDYVIREHCRYILFDLDETLYDYVMAAKKAGVKIAEMLGIEHGKYLRLYDQAKRIVYEKFPYTHLKFSKRLVFEEMKKIIGKLKLTPEYLEKVYWETIFEEIKPYDGVVETLRVLSERYKLVIASNGFRSIQVEKLKRMKLSPFFEYVICSEEAGVNKPDTGFFKYLLGKIGASPEHCVMVGDSPFDDIRGANNIGMRSVRVRMGLFKNVDCNDETGYPIFEIDEINKLLEIFWL